MLSHSEPNFIEKFFGKGYGLFVCLFVYLFAFVCFCFVFVFFFVFVLFLFLFLIVAKIKMTRYKDRLFGLHFETVQHFIYLFFPEIWFLIVHTYMGANFIAKVWWKNNFLRDVPWKPLPLAPTGVKVRGSFSKFWIMIYLSCCILIRGGVVYIKCQPFSFTPHLFENIFTPDRAATFT